MTSRWQRVEEIFHGALDRDADDRAAFLDSACQGDAGLREEVESLLRTARSAEGFLEQAPMASEPLVGRELGPYRLEALVGSGGMGDVYRALDTRLGRTVALKLLPERLFPGDERLRRFTREARAASALNHPNIVTIHAIGQADGLHFIAQEFIEGTTLRQRLAESRMSRAAAIDVAIQVATALATAHEAGIIHRDVKPENVMIRADGYVKVLDFGLAKRASISPVDTGTVRRVRHVSAVSTHSGVIAGTARYMSPEQARGERVDQRTDLFSLGVMLYEMLAGRVPFSGATDSDVMAAILRDEPPPLTDVAPDVAPDLADIVAKCLQKLPAERYRSARDLAGDLRALGADAGGGSSTTTARVTSRDSVWRPVAVAIVLISLAVGAVLFSPRARVTLTDQDTILLAEFENTTGEHVFDGRTLRQALAIQLRQTPFLSFFQDEAIRNALRFMNRPVDTRLTRDVGREICQRYGLKALVTGTIGRVGGRYVITLEAIAAGTGTTIAVDQAVAEDQQQVLRALGDAAVGLRKNLGESLSTLQAYAAPIEQATTSSLDALRAFSIGLEHVQAENGAGAIPFFVQATELDPAFLAAYDNGAWAYGIRGDVARAAAFAAQAYGLRHRGTERERISASTTYHHYATGDLDEENRLCDVWRQLYPHDWVPYSCLALNYLFPMARFEEAAGLGRALLTRSPHTAHGYRFLAPALMHLGRVDEAVDVAQQALDRGFDNVFLRATRYQLAIMRQDPAGTARALDAIRTHEGERPAQSWQARTLAFQGRWREARELFFRVAAGQATAGREVPFPIEAAQRGSELGLCRDVQPGIARVLNPARMVSPVVPYTPAIGTEGSLCGQVGAALHAAEVLATRFPRSTVTQRMSLPLFYASVALTRNQPAHAIEILRTTGPGDAGRFDPAYLRGQAFIRLGRFSEAAEEFRSIVDRRGRQPTSVLYPLAHLGLARAASSLGDTAASRRAYEDLFMLWQHADSDLPPLVEAHKEYARLGERR